MLTGHPAHIDSSGTSAAKEERLRGSDLSTSQIHTLDEIGCIAPTSCRGFHRQYFGEILLYLDCKIYKLIDDVLIPVLKRYNGIQRKLD